ncbi:unnamed protein product, partial [Vitis vinifera]|uniref:Uncharacterized protein n=1 Tax=Vitis vinifera TaxID=29760 RepID=D7T3E2_VITVI
MLDVFPSSLNCFLSLVCDVVF